MAIHNGVKENVLKTKISTCEHVFVRIFVVDDLLEATIEVYATVRGLAVVVA